jgi:hypothetical protein
MSLFAIQTIWKQTQYYGCCNQHGFPALMRLWETLPKTRGFNPISRDGAPFGPNTAEVENKAITIYLCDTPPQMNLPTRQNANPKYA